MRFTKLYEDIKASDLFKPASEEEIAKRKDQYIEMKLKDALDVKKTKLPDGTWHIYESLNVSGCNLTSLKTLNVSIVDKAFSCFRNKLTTLEGAPTKVGGYFSCSNNTLTSLEGAPKEVDGDFECHHNRKQFTEDEVRAVCVVKGGIYV